MTRPLRWWMVVVLSCLLTIFFACSRHDAPAPTEEAPGDRVAVAEGWFAQQPPLRAVPTGIDWHHARTIDSWVVAPLADTTNFFAREHKHGYRYLVVQTIDERAITGRIVELVQDGTPLSAEQAAQKALHITQRLLVAPESPAFSAGFTGWAMVYSPAYAYETGFVYEQGVAQSKRVRLLLPDAARATKKTIIAGKTTQTSLSIDDPTEVCAMVQVCGYVNGDLSNCIYVEHCTGGTGGGGGPGGGDGGWGGGDGGGSDTPEILYNAETEAPTIGDTRKIMSKMWSAATTIKVVLEYTKSNHSVDKVTVTSTGLAAATKFAQVGNGIASYNYATQSFSYNATFQQVLSTGATGDLLGGPLFEVYGKYYPSNDKYSIEFRQIP